MCTLDPPPPVILIACPLLHHFSWPKKFVERGTAMYTYFDIFLGEQIYLTYGINEMNESDKNYVNVFLSKLHKHIYYHTCIVHIPYLGNQNFYKAFWQNSVYQKNDVHFTSLNIDVYITQKNGKRYLHLTYLRSPGSR